MAAKSPAKKKPAKKKSPAKKATTKATAKKAPAKKTSAAAKKKSAAKKAPAKKTRAKKAPKQIPFVDYLVLGKTPYLRANECKNCGARFFDRRNACAACSATDFHRVRIASEGELRTFTIVAFAAPGVEVPFVSGVIDCAGTSVRANLRDVTPDADHVHTGMQVRLTTYSLGTDDNGTEAIGFAYEPIT